MFYQWSFYVRGSNFSFEQRWTQFLRPEISDCIDFLKMCACFCSTIHSFSYYYVALYYIVSDVNITIVIIHYIRVCARIIRLHVSYFCFTTNILRNKFIEYIYVCCLLLLFVSISTSTESFYYQELYELKQERYPNNIHTTCVQFVGKIRCSWYCCHTRNTSWRLPVCVIGRYSSEFFCELWQFWLWYFHFTATLLAASEA
jgi:hypothetical protein